MCVAISRSELRNGKVTVAVMSEINLSRLESVLVIRVKWRSLLFFFIVRRILEAGERHLVNFRKVGIRTCLLPVIKDFAEQISKTIKVFETNMLR